MKFSGSTRFLFGAMATLLVAGLIVIFYPHGANDKADRASRVAGSLIPRR
jgi:hypothetical protein